MARIVKEYDERHAEFLDAAQMLFFTKGYEQTSVQDIIQAVGVAKGTFYHYFNSKAEILDAMVRRMAEQIVASLEPLLIDDSLDAIQKLEQFFAQINQWKVSKKKLMLDMARVLYQDENILLRQKRFDETVKTASPILAQIIAQGINEGVFDVAYPQETAEMIFGIGQTFSETLIPLLLSGQHNEEDIEHMKRHLHVYNESITRVLGMASSSIELISMDMLNDWL